MDKKKGPVSKIEIPWPFWLILLLAMIGGVWAAYFLVWKNLKKIKPDAAKQFKLWAAGVILIYQAALVVVAVNGINASNLSQVLLFAIPIWFEIKYFRKWRGENPETKPRFQFPMLGWGLTGLAATILMWYTTILIVVNMGW